MKLEQAVKEQVCIKCDNIEQRDRVVGILEAGGVKTWEYNFLCDNETLYVLLDSDDGIYIFQVFKLSDFGAEISAHDFITANS